MSRFVCVLRSVSVVVAFAAASVVAGAPVACGGDGEGTTGRRVALELRVVGSPAARAPFTNGAGWSVGLAKALVATGPMTFWDGAPIFSSSPFAPRPARGLSFAGRTAFAHPGHYVEGEARGEVLVGSSVDLRGDAVVIGRGAGVSGTFRSATFAFGSPAAGPFAGELGAAVVVLEGTATKGAETRRFRAAVAAAEIAGAKSTSSVEGCAFAPESDVQADGVVEVTVKVETWLDQVDFGELAVASEPSSIAPGSVAHNALVRGMKSGSSYGFRFVAR